MRNTKQLATQKVIQFYWISPDYLHKPSSPIES